MSTPQERRQGHDQTERRQQRHRRPATTKARLPGELSGVRRGALVRRWALLPHCSARPILEKIPVPAAAHGQMLGTGVDGQHGLWSRLSALVGGGPGARSSRRRSSARAQRTLTTTANVCPRSAANGCSVLPRGPRMERPGRGVRRRPLRPAAARSQGREGRSLRTRRVGGRRTLLRLRACVSLRAAGGP